MSDLELKVKSALLNVLVAALSIVVLVFFVLGGLKELVLFLLFWGTISTFLFGWLLSGWYIQIPNEKWLIEPYLATTVISVPSAICTGLIYMSYIALDSHELAWSEVAFSGVFGGMVAVVYSLPISLICGLLIGLYFKRAQKL